MMRFLWRDNNSFVVKLGVSLVSFLLASTLLHHISSRFSLVPHAPLLQITHNSSASVSINGEKCDLFMGDWVPYYKGETPYNKSCRFIVDHQNCMKNGRPDTDYLHWKWSPRGCGLPSFDPLKFLETMRNKSWAFVGDSISRNHIESLLCMLSTVEQAVHVYHDEGYKTQKWLFPSYNLTASVIWSPFLAKSIIPANIYEASPSEIDLHLDILDPSWTDQFKSWDYMIISSGKWYGRSAIYYENNTILGCYNCRNRNITELGYDLAYRRVIKNVLDYINTSNHKGSVFYRTNSPDHFEGNEWYSGGTCSRKEPVKEGEFELSLLDKTLREIEMEEFAEAEVRGDGQGVKKLRLFDVSLMSLLRPDGHPGVYRSDEISVKERNGEVISDCLHWCLPGPIDSWNDVLMEMIVNG